MQGSAAAAAAFGQEENFDGHEEVALVSEQDEDVDAQSEAARSVAPVFVHVDVEEHSIGADSADSDAHSAFGVVTSFIGHEDADTHSMATAVAAF